jgi:excisionase family DNA binding protein
MPNQLDFSALIAEPSKIGAIPATQIPALLTQLSTLQTAMAARLIPIGDTTSRNDDMLAVAEAAKRLGVSVDWLYRRTSRLPFVVRLGRQVRFSAQGIDRYLKNRAGR